MSFGELQLKKFGWKEGKGLGRCENGISDAIKPKLKFNSSGIGYDVANEFSFQWWDHVYNKAAKNITIDKKQNGEVVISKKTNLNISTKKKQKKVDTSCYGYFVKGSKVLNGDDNNTKDSQSDSSDSSEEESQELLKTLTDEELFRNCGGLTGHKGARHGIKMSAKLARLQAQEQIFADRYKVISHQSLTNQSSNLSTKLSVESSNEAPNPEDCSKLIHGNNEGTCNLSHENETRELDNNSRNSSKKKKKKKKSHNDPEGNSFIEENVLKVKKKKLKVKDDTRILDYGDCKSNDETAQNLIISGPTNEKLHCKHKKKRKL